MIGLFTGNGPCEVVENGRGKFITRAREFGWDRGSNMLYIDQALPKSQPAYTFLNGTFSSLNQNNTANTTAIAGMAIWHMLQGFLGAFPQYRPNDTAVGVHLFAESYGGKYGPAFATLWTHQNRLRSNGTLSQNGTIDIKLASLGIVNGCVDDLIQAPYYPAFAMNNSYNFEALNPTRASLAAASFSAPGGCAQLIATCRTAVASQDPENDGDVAAVNKACQTAYLSCTQNVMQPYADSGRSYYDITHFLPDSFPPSTYLEYLNTAEFQAAIGSPVNYTETNTQVVNAFTSTGDYERQALVPDLAALLRSGVRIGFIRVYDAGHAVPAYQPETAFEIFARIMSGTSVSTGEIINPSVSFHGYCNTKSN
ncbi:putative Carboxypeptidase S1 like protein B [Glarea lozoyensis 74030]|uniref:Carboxypeptidase n=1 Tax=Glarea lozoyensis (strain ATCC 74030 / MF5533) TaxID=1104152 RepID=H0EM59_GLAL7|nr:putative Carboxypeptidase S1 like protein B [Glarea lozoyensis 74030]